MGVVEAKAMVVVKRDWQQRGLAPLHPSTSTATLYSTFHPTQLKLPPPHTTTGQQCGVRPSSQQPQQSASPSMPRLFSCGLPQLVCCSRPLYHPCGPPPPYYPEAPCTPPPLPPPLTHHQAPEGICLTPAASKKPWRPCGKQARRASWPTEASTPCIIPWPSRPCGGTPVAAPCTCPPQQQQQQEAQLSSSDSFVSWPWPGRAHRYKAPIHHFIHTPFYYLPTLSSTHPPLTGNQAPARGRGRPACPRRLSSHGLDTKPAGLEEEERHRAYPGGGDARGHSLGLWTVDCPRVDKRRIELPPEK